MSNSSTIIDRDVELPFDLERVLANAGRHSVAQQRDLSIIRGDLVSLLQDTADLRACVAAMSLRKPSLTRRFVLLAGLLLLMFVAALIVFQPSLLNLLNFRNVCEKPMCFAPAPLR